MEEDKCRLISFTKHKEKIVARKKEKLLGDDLKRLSFSEILTQASEIAKTLNSSSLNDETSLRSKIFIKEISRRLEGHSQEMSQTIEHLNKGIETRLEHLRLLS